MSPQTPTRSVQQAKLRVGRAGGIATGWKLESNRPHTCRMQGSVPCSKMHNSRKMSSCEHANSTAILKKQFEEDVILEPAKFKENNPHGKAIVENAQHGERPGKRSKKICSANCHSCVTPNCPNSRVDRMPAAPMSIRHPEHAPILSK